MDIDESTPRSPSKLTVLNQAHRVMQRESPSRRQSTPASSRDDTAMEGSFHSAREDIRERTESVVPGAKEDTTHQNLDVIVKPGQESPNERDENIRGAEALERDTILADHDDSHSSSQSSSPAKMIARKSSLTFATLPAPEPWTTKKSMGTATGIGRGSFLGRVTGGKSIGDFRQQENLSQNLQQSRDEGASDDEINEKPRLEREESGTSSIRKMHNKSSTQTLQDKINALGLSQGPRPTKSIPNLTASSVNYPILVDSEPTKKKTDGAVPVLSQAVADPTTNNEEDSWILPPEISNSKQHERKAEISAVQDVIDAKVTKSPEVTEAGTRQTVEKPDGTVISPERNASEARPVTRVDNDLPVSLEEGPLSASKNKLQSIMKSARGLFSSSAGISAQAKMEALDSPAARTRGKAVEKGDNDPSDAKAMQIMSTMTKEINALSDDVDRIVKSRPVSPVKPQEGRRTRSSTEKEQKRKQDATDTALSAQEPSFRSSPWKVQNVQGAEETESHMDVDIDSTKSQVVKAMPSSAPSAQLQRPKNIQRPTKPSKEPVQRAKPAPVNIKIGLPSSWRGLPANSALSSSLQESLQPNQSKAGGLTKKPSNASLHTVTSNGSVRGATSTVPGKPKALLAAERKKEQDEKEARRKQDAKKEMEKRRAAQQEETRQQEVERQQEQERVVLEQKKAALAKQAIEKRRMDMKSSQRGPGQEKAPIARFRPETHDSRPPSRMEPSRPGPTHAAQNPAKMGIKRVFEQEPKEEPRPIRVPAGPAYAANEAKRRRTDDEEDFRETGIRPTMQPPKRVSTAQKVSSRHEDIFRTQY